MQRTEPPTSFDLIQMRRGARGPAWRFELAESLQQHSPFSRRVCRSIQKYGVHVRYAHAYAHFCHRGTDGRRQAIAAFPMIAAAGKLNQDETLCAQAKILVLGDCPIPEVAERLECDPQIVEVWEKLYFDIRESREAIGWIHARIIRPELNGGNGSVASKFKLAYLCGPVGARALLDAESRAPLTAAERLFDRNLKLHLRLDEAAAAPFVSDRDKFRFLINMSKLRQAEDRLEVQKQKLAACCEEALRKHERAKLRHAAAAERRKQRAEESIRKTQQRAQQKQQIAQAREEQRRLHGEALLAEQQAARARAAASPLARLTWSHAMPAQTDASAANQQILELQCVTEHDFVGNPDGNTFDEREYYDAHIEPEVAIA